MTWYSVEVAETSCIAGYRDGCGEIAEVPIRGNPA